MKKMISLLLVVSMFLILASACGKSAPEETTNSTGKESTDSQIETHGKDENSDTVKEEENTQPAAGDSTRKMMDAANTARQSDYYNNMAFDEKYIYFVSSHDLYRCLHDGSEVRKLETTLDNVFAAEGKLWGFYAEYQKPGAVYSMDPETGTMEAVSDMPYAGMTADLIQVSGKWLCYTRDQGNELIIHDLSSDEEKTVFTYQFGDLLRSIDSICIYGNTLYALVQDTSKDRNCVLCSYELGSGDERMTQLSKTQYLSATTTTVWMEEGILLIDFEKGCQYYYAKFSDIDGDKNWNYRKNEDNKIGTDMYADDAIQGIGMWINSAYNSNFVIGNDLLNIGGGQVDYYKDFDFTDRKILVENDERCDGSKGCHGIYDGSLYLFLDKNASSGAEIVKISEGGNVEHIPVTIPE